ncbi:MAG: cation transporter, partial [Candidatus Heimdallarchaeota archaeon]
VAAGVTLFAVRSSAKPADTDHQFGHGKIESLSALFETILLLITVIWIIYEATRRIITGEIEIISSPITFGVIILAIIVDYSRSRLLYKMADKYDSQALKADALHFSSDILSSSVVFLGLVFAALGYPLGDPLAAIGVAIIVLIMTLNLGKETVDSLLDRAPLGDKEKVQRAAAQVEGVISCEKIRLRKSGAITFVDLAIAVNPNLSLETAHAIGEQVILEIRKVIDSADVSLHMDPASKDLTPVIDAIRKEGQRTEWLLGIHKINAFEFKEKISIGLHIEVEPKTSLGEIHQKLNAFKQQLLGINSGIQEELLSIHIEPHKPKKEEKVDLERLIKIIETWTDKNEVLSNPHGIQLFTTPSGVFISFHCNAQPNLTIDEIHTASSILEEGIANEIACESQIYIYVEPQND